jgi:hypothetical protein
VLHEVSRAVQLVESLAPTFLPPWTETVRERVNRAGQSATRCLRQLVEAKADGQLAYAIERYDREMLAECRSVADAIEGVVEQQP